MTNTATNPTPRIQTELHFTIDGPHRRVEQVREWFKDSFKAWARDNFDQSVWRAEVKKRNGDVTVTIPVMGCAVPMIEKLAALFEQEFPGLSMNGSAISKSGWQFDTRASIDRGVVTVGPLAIDFIDAEGTPWRGRPGAYEEDWDDDFEDEQAEALAADGEAR